MLISWIASKQIGTTQMTNYKYPLNLTLLLEILAIQSESHNCLDMQAYLWDYVEDRGWSITCDNMGNLYIVKGTAENYPCIVAHMDTVHNIHKFGSIHPVIVNETKITGINPVTMRQTGIGGDDKCGIYAALECLNHLDYCKVVFFVDEEIGCVGSYRCDLDLFSNVRFILQADRRGNSDFVNDICGPISSKEFQRAVFGYMQKYGFEFTMGMMTDVMALSQQDVGVSCANISAGYYNPHQDHEYIEMRDLLNTTNMMLQICEELHDVYSFIQPPTRCDSFRGRNWLDLPHHDDPFLPETNLNINHSKPISQMTDEEWLAFNNEEMKELDRKDFEESIDSELARYDKYFQEKAEEYNESPHNPYV